MSLSVDARHCGTVYVIRCNGRIVAGEESNTLAAALTRGLREFRRLVIDLGEVRQLDSSGIGLLVRNLSHTRSRGGDLRLSTAPPFIANVLQATRLTTVFKVYGSEDEAIVSFLKEPCVTGDETLPLGPGVLFVDRSPDVCAFVRVLLNNNGYAVLSSCRTGDARLLLLSGRFDYLVLGPDCSQGENAIAVDTLKSLAASASILQLSSGFNYEDPERAGAELLRLLKSTKTATA
jgi:anti-sigma B factor antagonist